MLLSESDNGQVTTTLNFIGPSACFMVVRKNKNTGLC